MSDALTLEKMRIALDLLSQPNPSEEVSPNCFKVTAYDGSSIYCNRYYEPPSLIGIKQWILLGGSLGGKFLSVPQHAVTIEPLPETDELLRSKP